MISISIVIPFYNSHETLLRCVESACAAIQSTDEIILVNDGSSDFSLEIAQKFNHKILNFSDNKGAAFSRNQGASIAKNDLIIFLDSDVLIKKIDVELVREYFESHLEVQSFSASICSKESDLNFFTDYKNVYLDFVMSSINSSLNYIYGSFCGTRSKGKIPWPENLRMTEDSLWGYQHSQLGLEVHNLSHIKVKHLKKYSFKSLMVYDFKISLHFAYSFFKFNRWSTILGKETFGHVSKKQKISVMIAPLVLMSLFLSIKLSLLFLAFWFLINSAFFKFLYFKRNTVFLVKSIVWYFVDCHIYFIGIIYGFTLAIVEKNQRNRDILNEF